MFFFFFYTKSFIFQNQPILLTRLFTDVFKEQHYRMFIGSKFIKREKKGKNICGEVSVQLWLKYLKHTTCKNQRSRDASYFIKGCRYSTVLVEHICFSSGLCFCLSILYTLFLPLLKRLLFCCFNFILFIFIVALTQMRSVFLRVYPLIYNLLPFLFLLSQVALFRSTFLLCTKTGPDSC